MRWENKTKALKAFKKQQKRDRWLRHYCKSNNITLIEIDGRKWKAKKLCGYKFTLNPPNISEDKTKE